MLSKHLMLSMVKQWAYHSFLRQPTKCCLETCGFSVQACQHAEVCNGLLHSPFRGHQWTEIRENCSEHFY